ncbi:MAG: hypothetical protein LBR83_09520 [Clostridiales bacterium]|nr:hypothetical protein [Clostridiales bacterium]
MLWERAKNLMIVFFLVLNALLAWFLYRESNRYTLTQEREQAVYDVLRRNNVTRYTRIMRNYAPMRPLAISGYAYDSEALVQIFFDEPETVTAEESNPDESVYYTDAARLVISNGYISYELISAGGTAADEGAPRTASASALCEEFIRKHFPDYRADGMITETGGLRYIYRQAYQNYLVYGNFIEFFVTADGIAQIDMQYGTVLGFEGQEQEICPPDEALLTFIQRIRSLYGGAPVMLTQMDMVYYYQEEPNRRGYMVLQAVPYYRIFIEDQALPFLVNAYSNVCIN